jgi:putative N-acetylmannosamine-6-phosphate epimerase
MTIHYIKDPVHHLIKINNDDKKIMDTPLFQRLRNIFHLGTLINDLIADARYNPDNLEKWLAGKLKIEECRIMVSYAKFEPFNLAAAKDIPIDVSGSTKYAIGDFGLNIKDIAKYSNVPYIYVDKDQISNCLECLRDYSSSLIGD